MIHLITFASPRYESSRRRLVRSAHHLGQARVWEFSPRQFRATRFRADHRDIADTPRGAGLWLWKPYYIREVMAEASDGDIIMYVDAGVEIIAPVEPLLALLDVNRGVAMFRLHGLVNAQWTKRDCFVLMNCDRDEVVGAEQAMGTIVVFRKCALACELVAEWLRYACDRRIISDDDNVCGKPNYPGFRAHRHDQSILSNLRARFGLAAYCDPTQWGDAHRASALRGVDDYRALFDHHRQRAPSWRAALTLLVHDRRRFVAGVALHLRNTLRRRR